MTTTAEFFSNWEKDQPTFREQAGEIMKGFGALFQATMKEGAMTVREKELVALGIAVAGRCMPCINLHVKKCVEAGATRAQVIEAAGVAVMMQGGPAFTHMPEIIKALDYVAPAE
jgi:AhpD family alkylhydroperoxidase